MSEMKVYVQHLKEAQKFNYLNNKYNLPEYEKPDYYLIVRTFDNFKGYKSLAKHLPKFITKVVKVQYTINDEIKTIVNNYLITDENVNEISWLIAHSNNYGFEDTFNYNLLPKKKIYYF